jgi:hypothetical protein
MILQATASRPEAPMTISGLVITLDENEWLAEAALAALRDSGRFRIVARFGQRLAVVLEAENDRLARSWFEWAEQLTGVVQVDLAMTTVGQEA